VFVTDRVTANRIIGSLCVYMLLGMFFAFVFASMSLASPSTFSVSGEAFPAQLLRLRDFLFFSYAMLTTTGFDNLMPVHPIARAVVSVEEVTGSIYLAVVVARLVGIHVTQSRSHTR
jgi:hypothetical protein